MAGFAGLPLAAPGHQATFLPPPAIASTSAPIPAAHAPPKAKGKAAAKSDADKEKKKRSSKACDACRRAKCKCTPAKDAQGNDLPNVTTCANCLATQQTCTFEAITRKRGPPKGYLEQTEQRLHRLEAFLGSLIASDDPRAQALLQELVTDEESRDLLTADFRSAAASGPNGPVRRSWQPSTIVNASVRTETSAARSRNRQNGGFEVGHTSAAIGPGWSADGGRGDVAVGDDSDSESRSRSRGPGQPAKSRRRTDSSTTAASSVSGPGLFAFQSAASGGGSQKILHTGFSLGLSPASEPSVDPDPDSGPLSELADVVGQLSLNDKTNELRYHGRSSGLYLIAEESQRFRKPYWQFPTYIASSDPLGRSQEEILRIAGVTMPDAATQDRLLSAYFQWCHPLLPIIYRPTFSRTNANQAPPFLLNAMFALAARYCESETPMVFARHWPAGDEYFAAARAILAQDDYGASRLTTVQGLLLMSYREAGTGAMARSWALLGMAFRMSQDMGLHRDVDRWHVPEGLLMHEDKQTRKRCWAACLVLDRYLSAYIGRPMGIQERDYDTAFPSEEEPDERDPWSFGNAGGSHALSTMPSQTLSIFNRLGSLAALTGRIIWGLYALKTRVLAMNSMAMLAHLDQQMAKWYLALPDSMAYTPDAVQPPALLVLHLSFYTSLILLHRPFVPAVRPQLDDQGQPVATSMPSLTIALTSANAITSIMCKYERLYGLRNASPLMVFPCFSAAIMHVYTISRDPALAKSARKGLARCMRALKEMSGIWGSAARQYALLDGLVDLAEAEREGEHMTVTDVESVLRGRKRGHITEPPTGAQTPIEGNATMSDLAFRSQLDALAALLPARHEPLPQSQFGPAPSVPDAGSGPVFGEGLQFDDFLGSLLGAESLNYGSGGISTPRTGPEPPAPTVMSPLSMPPPQHHAQSSFASTSAPTPAPFGLPTPLDEQSWDWASMFAAPSNPWPMGANTTAAPAPTPAQQPPPGVVDPWRDLIATFAASSGLSPDSSTRSEHA